MLLLIVLSSCRAAMPTVMRNVPIAAIQTGNVNFARRIAARGATAAQPTAGMVIASAQEEPSLRRPVYAPRPVSTRFRKAEKRIRAFLHPTIPSSLIWSSYRPPANNRKPCHCRIVSPSRAPFIPPLSYRAYPTLLTCIYLMHPARQF